MEEETIRPSAPSPAPEHEYDYDCELEHEHLRDHEHLHEHDHEYGREHDHGHEHDHAHEHAHGHHHVHSEAEKKAVINRIARIAGHLEAVRRMVEQDADCSEVLIQLAAVRSALNSTGKLVLKNHLNQCLVEAVEEKDTGAIQKLNDAIDKFVK